MKSKLPSLRSAALSMLWMTSFFALNTFPIQAQDAASRRWRNDEKVYAPMTKVPADERARLNPLERDPNALAAGGKLYEEHCQECHGLKAEGTGRGPSLLKSPIQQASAGALFWILSNGVIRHRMPDWSKLPEPARWQIVTFLQSFKAPAGSQPRTKP